MSHELTVILAFAGALVIGAVAVYVAVRVLRPRPELDSAEELAIARAAEILRRSTR